MLHYLLAPRQLALHLLMMLLVAAMTWLCLWQLGKAQGDTQVSGEGPQQTVELSTVSFPGKLTVEAFDRAVHTTGRYQLNRNVSIPGRTLHGTPGMWIISPMVLGDGSVVAVARGWSPDMPPTLQANEATLSANVQVSGFFLPPEETPARPQVGPGQVAALDLATLAPLWGNPPLHEGYVLATQETLTPEAGEGGQPAWLAQSTLTPIPLSNAQTSDTGPPFSNAAYALQWLAFSAFVLFVWWRILRDGFKYHNPASAS